MDTSYDKSFEQFYNNFSSGNISFVYDKDKVSEVLSSLTNLNSQINSKVDNLKNLSQKFYDIVDIDEVTSKMNLSISLSSIKTYPEDVADSISSLINKIEGNVESINFYNDLKNYNSKVNSKNFFGMTNGVLPNQNLLPNSNVNINPLLLGNNINYSDQSLVKINGYNLNSRQGVARHSIPSLRDMLQFNMDRKSYSLFPYNQHTEQEKFDLIIKTQNAKMQAEAQKYTESNIKFYLTSGSLFRDAIQEQANIFASQNSSNTYSNSNSNASKKVSTGGGKTRKNESFKASSIPVQQVASVEKVELPTEQYSNTPDVKREVADVNSFNSNTNLDDNTKLDNSTFVSSDNSKGSSDSSSTSKNIPKGTLKSSTDKLNDTTNGTNTNFSNSNTNNSFGNSSKATSNNYKNSGSSLKSTNVATSIKSILNPDIKKDSFPLDSISSKSLISSVRKSNNLLSPIIKDSKVKVNLSNVSKGPSNFVPPIAGITTALVAGGGTKLYLDEKNSKDQNEENTDLGKYYRDDYYSDNDNNSKEENKEDQSANTANKTLSKDDLISALENF